MSIGRSLTFRTTALKFIQHQSQHHIQTHLQVSAFSASSRVALTPHTGCVFHHTQHHMPPTIPAASHCQPQPPRPAYRLSRPPSEGSSVAIVPGIHTFNHTDLCLFLRPIAVAPVLQLSLPKNHLL
ncbi:hypothetical protein LIA77_11059 [Sarocladium implicatum]|nr:hypothetical protein LIA77_11059 [Sarocladium implicatum]